MLKKRNPKFQDGLVENPSKNYIQSQLKASKKQVSLNPEMYRTASYKYSLGKDCILRLAKSDVMSGIQRGPLDVNHVLLALGDEIYSAGSFMMIEESPGKTKLYVTNQSTRFCPPPQSFGAIKAFLTHNGWKASEFEVLDWLPPGCHSQ